MTSLVMMLGDIKIVGYCEDDRGVGWLTVLRVMRTSDENWSSYILHTDS